MTNNKDGLRRKAHSTPASVIWLIGELEFMRDNFNLSDNARDYLCDFIIEARKVFNYDR